MNSQDDTFPNAEQSEIIQAVQESLLVLAPMGTGKTRTAAGAIARAIESGIEPEQILGLTFTNRAAEAMRGAVAEALPNESHRVHLFNLHALCARFLREEAGFAGLPPDFGILDEDESADLLWQYISGIDQRERFKNKKMEAYNAYEKYVFGFLMGETKGAIPPEFKMYRDALYRDGAVDFTGLIARTYRILKQNAQVRERWQGRYRWVLVDEVQDINLAEYRVISILAGKDRCLKFMGDPHQTIYEWRFAQPQEVLESFQAGFNPRRICLKTNYRCSRKIIHFSNSVRKGFIPSSDPLPIGTEGVGDGEIELRTFESSELEMEALVSRIFKWQQEGIPWKEMAVLARYNRTLVEVSSAFKEKGIPHLIAEEFDFFRRKEVKDITAVLQWMVSPFRRTPLIRILKMFGAREGSIEAFEKSAEGTGLHVGYLVRGTPGDPLQPLLEAWNSGEIVSMDTETTGLDPVTSEIIQMARVTRKNSWMEYVQPAQEVGESVHTHGLTDEFLRQHGKKLTDVLPAGLQFEPGEVLLGHNLAYDLWMLKMASLKAGLSPKWPLYFDTMPLAATLLNRERLKGLRLEMVSEGLGVQLNEAHDAEADARASLQILEKLMPQILEKQPERLRLMAEMSSETSLAFRKTSQVLRMIEDAFDLKFTVSQWIFKIWKIFQGIAGFYGKADSQREKHVMDLVEIADFLEKRKGGVLSIQTFLDQVSLGRRDMLLEADPHRVRLLSAHAAKGLEFDGVAMPRLIAGWNSEVEEEARVFYVMITRARHHLWMSWPRRVRGSRGEERQAVPLKYLSVLE